MPERNAVDCSPSGVEARWTESPLYLAMVDALTACGLANQVALGTITAEAKWTKTGVTDWPSPDPVVRRRFHALWTDFVQLRCGLDPKTATPEGQLTLRANPRPTALLLARPTNGRPPALTGPEAEAVIVRYQRGESSTALAEAFEVSRESVVSLLRRAGVPVRARGAHRQDAKRARAAEAVRRYHAGEHRVMHIAAAMQADYGTVARYLRDAGIVLNVQEAKRTGGVNRWAAMRAKAVGPLSEAA